MEYVIGIDGGGTKTKLVQANLRGEILNTYTSGATNILSSGIDTARNSIYTVLDELKEKNLVNCKYLCIGTAGAGRESIKIELNKMFREYGYSGELFITHDAETALIGGTGETKGILIIAGTGSICYGQNEKGETHRVSGWGHIVGDEGSAYYIGVKIITAIMKAYDGRYNKTVLTKLMLEHLNLDNEEQIITYIYNKDIKKQDIASYAILIEQACNLNDSIALEIINQTINELVQSVIPVVNKLNFVDKKVKLVTNGSVIVNNKLIRGGFIKEINNLFPNIDICDMKYDSAYGAVLKALFEYNHK